MQTRLCLLLGIVLSLAPRPASAQDALPVVDEVEFSPLHDQIERLLKALEGLKAPLPEDTDKGLRPLLRDGAKDAGASQKIQKLIDGRCLFGVTINPESRVKAARGSLSAQLVRDQPAYVLVKVNNDAGVTAPLKVEGPQLRGAGQADGDAWLEATVMRDSPLAAKLTGQKLEYVVLRLTARESGKREATFRFDVGQGTQDLGFRAEVPVLFSVREKP
jgi:hypothetical protein